MRRFATPRVKVLAAAVVLSFAYDAHGQTFTVTNANDVGAGSLRQAISDANSACAGSPMSIVFGIGTGVQAIQPLTPLPPMPSTCAVTLDGESQPPGGPGQRIFLDGSLAGPSAIGLQGFAGGSVVRGLAIGNFAGGGIDLGFGSASGAYGNFIGVDPDGVTPRPNGPWGIRVTGSSAMIGGPGASRNVVSGNSGSGILVPSGGPVFIHGNLIGVAPDGATPMGNGGDGVRVDAFAFSVEVGGPGAGNVIAHNGGSGVNNNFPFPCTNLIVAQNSIFDNAGLGIDRSQAQPVQVPGPVSYTATDSTIAWSGSGFFANQSVTIDFYSNDDPLLGIDEGQRYVGSCGPVLADGSGAVASCPITVSGVVRNVTTTVPMSFGGTSRFSAPSLEPGMSPSPASLAFPSTPLGALSSPVVLNIVNPGAPGDPDLTIDSIVNPSAGEFFDTTGGGPGTPPGPGAPYCGLGSDLSGAPLTGTSTTIGPGGSCTLNMAFRPQASGTRTGTLIFNDAATPGYTVSVSMTGAGGTVVPLPTGVTFSPTSLTLPGPVPAFSTLSINVANPNGAPAQGLALTQSLPAGLVIAPTPNATVTGASCSGSFLSAAPGGTSFTVDSLFVPTSGACNLNIDVTGGAPGVYPVSVPAGAMTGGTILSQAVSNALSTPSPANLAVNAASLMMSPPSPVDFGAVTVGSSAPVSVTLTNTGAATLGFSSPFAITGANAADFSFTDTCLPDPIAQLGPGASCTVAITFAPSAIGGRSASMSFPSNTLTSPDVLNLTGTGTALPVPVVSLTPSGMLFPPQTVGTTSAPQAATLTNVGTAPLAISGIGTAGDFAQSSACGTSLAPTVSCTISVTFTPVTAGLRTGDLKVFSNASGSPHIVALDGDGVAPPVPTITAPTSVTFPTTQVGSASSPVSITITNSGGGPLVVSAVEIVGTGFTKASDSCTGVTVTPSSSCVVSVTFSPATAGSTTATLRILSNAPTSPTFVGLVGTGSAAPVGILSASASTLSFAAQVVGTTSAAQGLVITNTGGATVTVSSITMSGDFAQAGSCASIPAGGSCTVNVTFTPTATGTRTGALSIASDASNAPLSVGLTGTATPVPAPVIELSASSLSYGNALVGGGGSQALTLRNVGGAPLTIANLRVTGEFQATSGCPAVVPAGESCRIDVGFRPTIPGPRAGRIDVLSDASNGTKGADLAGTGCKFSFLNRVIALVCQ